MGLVARLSIGQHQAVVLRRGEGIDRLGALEEGHGLFEAAHIAKSPTFAFEQGGIRRRGAASRAMPRAGWPHAGEGVPPAPAGTGRPRRRNRAGRVRAPGGRGDWCRRSAPSAARAWRSKTPHRRRPSPAWSARRRSPVGRLRAAGPTRGAAPMRLDGPSESGRAPRAGRQEQRRRRAAADWRGRIGPSGRCRPPWWRPRSPGRRRRRWGGRIPPTRRQHGCRRPPDAR